MSRILTYIKEHIGPEEWFTPSDISMGLNMNHKVVQMNLKRLHNNETLHYYSQTGSYWLRTDEQIREKRIEVNTLIDKYNLKQRKYKL